MKPERLRIVARWNECAAARNDRAHGFAGLICRMEIAEAPLRALERGFHQLDQNFFRVGCGS